MYNIEHEVEFRLGDLYNTKQEANKTWCFVVKKNHVTPPEQHIPLNDPELDFFGMQHRNGKVKGAFEFDAELFSEVISNDTILNIPVFDDCVGSTATHESVSLSKIGETRKDLPEETITKLKSIAENYTGYAFSYARSWGDRGIGLLNDHWAYNSNIFEYEKHSNWWFHETPAYKYDENPEQYKHLVVQPFCKKHAKLVWRGADSGRPPKSMTPECTCRTDGDNGNYNEFQMSRGYHLKSCHRRDLVTYYNKIAKSEMIDLKFLDAHLVNCLNEGWLCDDCIDKLSGTAVNFEQEFEGRMEGNCSDHIMQTLYDANTKYKYLLHIQGNDYASNQWWIHGTSCVVLSPDFEKSKTVWNLYLEPWKHYVPFDAREPGDLLEKIKWCESNETKCEEIIKNSNQLHKVMLDRDRRREVFAKMAPYIEKNLIV